METAESEIQSQGILVSFDFFTYFFKAFAELFQLDDFFKQKDFPGSCGKGIHYIDLNVRVVGLVLFFCHIRAVPGSGQTACDRYHIDLIRAFKGIDPGLCGRTCRVGTAVMSVEVIQRLMNVKIRAIYNRSAVG